MTRQDLKIVEEVDNVTQALRKLLRPPKHTRQQSKSVEIPWRLRFYIKTLEEKRYLERTIVRTENGYFGITRDTVRKGDLLVQFDIDERVYFIIRQVRTDLLNGIYINMQLRSKRKFGAIAPSNQSIQVVQPSKKRKTGSAKNGGRTADAQHPRLSLLGMPAEIRNRIYQFATDDYVVDTVRFLDGDEDAFDIDTSPQILKPRVTKYKPWSKTKPAKPHYPFFGLSQVCRQLRAEYRPLWLSSSTFAIKYQDLEALLGAFFSEDARLDGDSQEAVGLGRLIIDWEDRQSAQLLPILRFAHRYPNTTVAFSHVPTWTPLWLKVKCPDCGHRGSGARKPLCEHKSDRLDDWTEAWPDMHNNYLTTVHALLSHDNEAWKSDIRTGFIERVDLPVWRDLNPFVENKLDHLSMELTLSRKNSSSWMPLERFRGHETCLSQEDCVDDCVWGDYLEGIDLPALKYPDTVYITM
ncbi:uncharacterized protein N0V89_003232 [Didymosphaeria variabile]|uniref:Uncharacterized protein n=1 Tax=Didymosphaeria variabile TaxID=1932322 RepID=A0A9W8XUZ9_9PLEO|nr:uncharacterized protein N0V89_003232 [Didymosphaeria variabile]KAJ4358648.1 hypothetical protein N0V89_003232 [Didymosphaeria variabile]